LAVCRKKNINFNISLGPFGNTAYSTTISAHRTISVSSFRLNIANMVDRLVNAAVRETGGCGAVASHICDALHRSSFLLDFIIESMLMYTSWLVKLDRRTRERLSFAANTRLDSARMMLIKSKACETQATFRRLRFRFGGTRSIIEHSDMVCIISTRMWFGRATHRIKFERAIRPGRIRYVAEVFENQTLNSDGNWKHVEGNWYSDESGTAKLVKGLDHILPPPHWVFTPFLARYSTHNELCNVPTSCLRVCVCKSAQPREARATKLGADAFAATFSADLGDATEPADSIWKHSNICRAFSTHFTFGKLRSAGGTTYCKKIDLARPYYSGINGRALCGGWEWRGKWVVDRTRLTDPEGWVYSTQNNFDEDIIDTLDYVEHTEDRFRCRRLKRQRVIIADLTRLIEPGRNSDSPCWEYARTLYDPLHWQQKPDDKFRRRLMRREMKPPSIEGYSLRRNIGIRIQQDKGREDASRNAEVESVEHEDETEGRKTARRSKNGKDSDETNEDCDKRESAGIDKGNRRTDCLPAGVYEVYDEASVWELRASILWGRDLLLDGAKSRRPFVRVVFRNRCIETAVVTSYVSPIWMETLVLLCGSVRNLRTNPPPIIVEVRSDELDKSEPFLGRFITMPSTCCTHHGRPPAIWFPLQFPDGATRGALLASFELFLHDRNQECSVPPRPANKNLLSSRYSADSSICPLFGQYTVHILCLGIRDYVSCSRLSAMQRAYVEVRIGDRVGRTDAIQQLKLNPNFARPVLTLDSVALPRRLCYAPPLTFSLHQLSPFPFASAVAVCEVTSFAKYLRKVPQEYEGEDVGWRNFDRVLRDEEAIEARMEFCAKEESNSIIDWWSKYYASIGDKRRAPGFDESGIQKLTVLESSLEDARNYHAFSDFIDTFTFVEPPSGKSEIRISPTSRGQLRARIYIQEKRDKSSQSYRRGDGTCDPYISVRCGNHKANTKKEVRIKDLNPIFGRLIEMKVDIPRDKKLIISVLDKHRILPGAARTLVLSWFATSQCITLQINQKIPVIDSEQEAECKKTPLQASQSLMAFILGGQEIEFELSNSPNFAEGKCETPKYHHHYLSCCDTCFPKLDCEIGHTEVDLEKRLFTRYRATVGLSSEYCINGLFPWRDNMSPLAILKR
uniref:C2 domain-containing protein n=1 Tax=Ascaris lumbricoides TaxID=6252 RepID=A0A9J2PVH2_ASCLU